MLLGVGKQANKSRFWDPLPLYVGASYDIVDNIICEYRQPEQLELTWNFLEAIPMGLLQPPFFEDDRPMWVAPRNLLNHIIKIRSSRYLNYASIGSFFGHELSHSVTPRYSGFENLLPPWSEQFLKEYINKAQCFVVQYTSFYDKAAELHVSWWFLELFRKIHIFFVLQLDGMRTFEEDMSDLAGIRAAFHAYRLRSQNEPAGQKLQDLPEFSTDALFFLSFAQVNISFKPQPRIHSSFLLTKQKWCRSNSRLQIRHKISRSVHSPEKYRVNGALSNFDMFAQTFNCSVGSPMNPAKECESW